MEEYKSEAHVLIENSNEKGKLFWHYFVENNYICIRMGQL